MRVFADRLGQQLKPNCATESVKRGFDYLFKALNKRWIITSINHNNKNYIRLVKRIGFRKEAHFVERLLINGKRVKI